MKNIYLNGLDNNVTPSGFGDNVIPICYNNITPSGFMGERFNISIPNGNRFPKYHLQKSLKIKVINHSNPENQFNLSIISCIKYVGIYSNTTRQPFNHLTI